MIRTPSTDKKFSIPNNSDLFGNIRRTKNISADEDGYLKLSPRTISIVSEKDDANMELPIAFGRTSSNTSTVSFHVVTSEDPFDVLITESVLSATEDVSSGNPNFTLDSYGSWFHTYWVTTDDNGFLFLNTSGAWTTTYTSSLTTSKPHPIEKFSNRDTICFGNGNVVKQYTETGGTFTASTDLTLPTDFEVVSLKYSNYKMGILTQLNSTNSGQNQDAYFFVWDGSTSYSGPGIPIGSDRGIALVAYMGSWVILTRTGQLLFYTGGGWKSLASFPFYFQDLIFGSPTSRDLYGDILQVDGEIIFVNFNGVFGSYGQKYQAYSADNAGGIYCYDPKVGLYQRNSFSISPGSMLTVTSANINTTTNVFTKTGGTVPSTGSPIKYTVNKQQQISGLTIGEIYYCIKLSSSTFKLATTKGNALDGIAIDITGTGAANNYFLAVEVYDYGVTLANNVGGIALVGTNHSVAGPIICGAELYDFDSVNSWNHIQLAVNDFENRGYFITSKTPSGGITDLERKSYLKFLPLKNSDKIILKHKQFEVFGLPISTPQATQSGSNQCIWDSPNSFHTSANLSDAKTAFDANIELECEIISGAGAGVMEKITSLDYSGGVYSIGFDIDIDGAASSRYCDIIIDNWRIIGEATSADQRGYKEISIAQTVNINMCKVELRGSNVKFEELVILGETIISK